MSISEDLIIQEFKELHEHIRQQEGAVVNLTIVMITTSVGILSAVAIFYFRTYFQKEILETYYSYLFLSPILITLPLLSSIRGHRQALYKLGAYIKIFIEEEFNGALWHVRKEKYQESRKEESLDSIPAFAWFISIISYSFFIATLLETNTFPNIHCFIPLIFIPFLIYQTKQHANVKSGGIEETWRNTKKIIPYSSDI